MPFIADPTQLKPGSIVRVEKPLASSGRPTYPHFFIVLFVPDPLKPGDQIPLVGISSRIDPKSIDPAKHVPMRWLNRKGGHPETGFTKPSHACMDFTHVLQVCEGDNPGLEVAAEHHGKFIRSDKFQAVVNTMNAWLKLKQS